MNLLLRTAGPYIWVKMRRTQSEQSQSALPHQADLNERCRHFADGPEADDETERLGIPKANDKLELLG